MSGGRQGLSLTPWAALDARRCLDAESVLKNIARRGRREHFNPDAREKGGGSWDGGSGQ